MATRKYKEAAKYEDTPAQVKNREARNKARTLEVKDNKASKGDNNDVDHIKPLSKGGKTVHSNLRVEPKEVNRSFTRNGHQWAGEKGTIAHQHLMKHSYSVADKGE